MGISLTVFKKFDMAQQITLTDTVKSSQLGQRLDQAVAELFTDFSRSRIKEWLLDGKIKWMAKLSLNRAL